MNALTHWKSRPLRVEEKQDFMAAQPSLAGENATLWRDNRRLLWGIVGGAVIFGLASTTSPLVIVPHLLKAKRDVLYVRIHDDGHTSVVASAKDAPLLFDERTERHWIQIYSECWEEFSRPRDAENDRKVKILSSQDQRSRYEAWRREPTGPVQNPSQQVDTWGYRFYREAVHDGVVAYRLTFKRRITDGSSVLREEQWAGEIQFRFEPRLEMTDEQVAINSVGMIVSSYKADKAP